MKRVFILLQFVTLLWTALCFAGEFEDGLAAHARGDYKAAFAIWTRAANQGDSKA
jgi:hypothetical protein